MGKGDARRPATVDEQKIMESWERTFGKVPAPPREAVEPHNAGSESFGEREEEEFALILGEGYVRVRRGPPMSDHLPGGAFSKEKSDE